MRHRQEGGEVTVYPLSIGITVVVTALPQETVLKALLKAEAVAREVCVARQESWALVHPLTHVRTQ